MINSASVQAMPTSDAALFDDTSDTAPVQRRASGGMAGFGSMRPATGSMAARSSVGSNSVSNPALTDRDKISGAAGIHGNRYLSELAGVDSVADLMDAPAEASITEGRATIQEHDSSEAATQAFGHYADAPTSMDAPKEQSIIETRATIRE